MKTSKFLLAFVLAFVFSASAYSHHETGTQIFLEVLSEKGISYMYQRKSHNMLILNNDVVLSEICDLAKRHFAFVNVIVDANTQVQFDCHASYK